METNKERIEREADIYFNNLEYRSAISESEMIDCKRMYIAGATAELQRKNNVSEGSEVPKEESKHEKDFWINWLSKRIEMTTEQKDLFKFALGELQSRCNDLREQLKQKDEKLKRITDYLSGLPEFQEKLEKLLSTPKTQ